MRHIVSQTVKWLGGRLTILPALLLIVAGTWAFFELADELGEREMEAFEHKVLQALRKPDDSKSLIGPEWMDDIVRDITALGGYAVLTLLTLAVVGFLCLDRKFAASWFVVGTILSGFAVSMSLKAFFDRPRPTIVPPLSEVYTSSFPSGHSMMSTIIFFTLGTLLATVTARRRLKFYFLVLAVLLTGLVGASRVYLGVHYPTDVLAGWSAGLVWSSTCWLIARSLQRCGRINTKI